MTMGIKTASVGRCCGALALGLLLSVAVRADAIYENPLSYDENQGSGSFESADTTPETHATRVSQKTAFCCLLSTALRPAPFEDFSFLLEPAQGPHSAPRKRLALTESTDGPLDTQHSASGTASSATAQESAEQAYVGLYADAYGGGGGFVESGTIKATTEGHPGSASAEQSTWLSAQNMAAQNSGPVADSTWLSDQLLDRFGAKGKPVTATRDGKAGTPVATSAPLGDVISPVSEPGLLALLAAGLTAMGLAMLAREGKC
jgi:hypothetical protein